VGLAVGGRDNPLEILEMVVGRPHRRTTRSQHRRILVDVWLEGS
jgi:hypothetical protein